METNLLDRMLSAYQTEKTVVCVTLQNKIRVTGKIKTFDSYVVVVEGQKREILYRHAISSLSAAQEEKHQPAATGRPAQVREKPAPRPDKQAVPKPRPAPQPAAHAASAHEPGINNTMKDALLKWMQGQNASK